MPRYSYGSDSANQYQGSNFDPLTGRLSGGQLVMQVINEMAARKKQKQQEGWEVEDRAIKNDYLKAQSENLRETKPTPQQKMTSFQEWMELGKQLGLDPKDWALEFKRADAITPEQRKANAQATTEGVIAGGGKVGGGTSNAAWKDEAVNLGKLITAKISSVDKEIERYNGYKKKADEEFKKYSSMKNKLAAQKSAEAKQAFDEANKSIRSLELYKKQIMAHQTNIKPDKPVDEITRAAIVSDYPKTISDIIYGGQNLDIDTSSSAVVPDIPSEGDQRRVRINGVEKDQIYKGGKWVDIRGK